VCASSVLMVIGEGSSRNMKRVLGFEEVGESNSLSEVSTSSRLVKGTIVDVGCTMQLCEVHFNKESRTLFDG